MTLIQDSAYYWDRDFAEHVYSTTGVEEGDGLRGGDDDGAFGGRNRMIEKDWVDK